MLYRLIPDWENLPRWLQQTLLWPIFVITSVYAMIMGLFKALLGWRKHQMQAKKILREDLSYGMLLAFTFIASLHRLGMLFMGALVAGGAMMNEPTLVLGATYLAIVWVVNFVAYCRLYDKVFPDPPTEPEHPKE